MAASHGSAGPAATGRPQTEVWSLNSREIPEAQNVQQHPHQTFVFARQQEESAMLRERLASNLKQLRRKRGRTRETTAERYGISPRYWGKPEQGKATVSLDTPDKIAAGLQLEPKVLRRDPDDTQS